MIPALKVPLTTKIPRGLIMSSGWRTAAETAIQALNDLEYGRERVFGRRGMGFSGAREGSNSGLLASNLKNNPLASMPLPKIHPQEFALSKFRSGGIIKGVAKLGFSWEAMDVRHWDSPASLAEQIEGLVVQTGNRADLVLVQEFVEIDVEMRCFVVLPEFCGTKIDADTRKAKFCGTNIEKIVYTCYESSEENHFSDFNRFDRATCVKNRFNGDEKALQDAEDQAKILIARLLVALRGECAEMPPVLRFDILTRKVGPGKSEIMVGEITELGACFLGWSEGPKTCFGALVRSCLGANERGCWGPSKKGGYLDEQSVNPMYPVCTGGFTTHPPCKEGAVPEMTLESGLFLAKRGGEIMSLTEHNGLVGEPNVRVLTEEEKEAHNRRRDQERFELDCEKWVHEEEECGVKAFALEGSVGSPDGTLLSPNQQ